MAMPFDSKPSALILCTALGVDVFLGEWPKPIHPVVWVGKLIAGAQRLAARGPWYQQLATGVLLAAILPGACAALTLLLLRRLAPWPVASYLAQSYLLKSTFALRALGQAAQSVAGALAQGNLPQARGALASLCSRNAQPLGAPLLVAATVESLAENTSDSFVAPLFFYILFGLPGAVCYRTVNTLDAMVGYRGVYEYFGKASARMDDALNYIPARLTAGLFLLAGCGCSASVGDGWAMLRRDKNKTDSVNAGWPMATMAGLLRVQLENVGRYSLGNACEALAPSKIAAAWRLTKLACGLAVCLALVALGGQHAATA